MDPVTYRELGDAQARATRLRVDEAEERVVDTPGGPMPIRVFLPEDIDGAYLYIHGGAWMGGARDLGDQVAWPRAQRGRVAVVSIDYRLAPEHPWPAAGDDCEAAALWFVDYARRELGTDRLLIGGDSAGAHLSVVTLLRLRDRHGLRPFCGADLRYGMYDMRLTPSARETRAGFFDGPTLRWVVDTVFPPALRDGPDASPLLADLAGLPPALFTVGTADSMLDDTLLMWFRWQAAGNQAELRLHPGCPHAFDYFPLLAAERAVDDSAAFIRSCLAAVADSSTSAAV
jgi:acetyl esterase/lipase